MLKTLVKTVKVVAYIVFGPIILLFYGICGLFEWGLEDEVSPKMIFAAFCIGFLEYGIPIALYTGRIKYSGNFDLVRDGQFLALIVLLVSSIGCAIFDNLTP